MATSENFVLSKENIQPLKEGRSTTKLGTALHAQYDDSKFKELVREKEKFETLIRTYKGEDPLQLWCDYVLWVEQSFPTNSQHGNLSILLEKCLTYFKDKKEYFDDIRLIKLWIKYIEYSHNSLEMFSMIYSHGIGKKTALFYRWWAYEYEKEENFKRADKVYLLGLKNQAQPLDELQYAHKQFQIKVGQITLGKAINSIEPPIPKREVLASLRSQSSVAPHIRQGPDFIKGRAGVIPQNIEDNKQRCPLKIYQDENIKLDQFKIEKEYLTKVPEIQSVVKENTQAPGQWSNKPHSVTAGYRIREGHYPHAYFEIFEDSSNKTLHKCITTNFDVLKAKAAVAFKDDFPICVNEPPDPTKKPMYPKHLIYAGGEEFQLEEIRHLLRLEKESIKNKANVKEVSEENSKTVPICSTQKESNEVFNSHDINIKKPRDLQTEKVIHAETPKPKQKDEELVDPSDKELIEPTFPVEDQFISHKRSFNKKKKSENFRKLNFENEGIAPPSTFQESMTVNSKEVQKLMKNLWSDEPSTIIEPAFQNENTSDKKENKVSLLKENEFQIFLDNENEQNNVPEVISSNFKEEQIIPTHKDIKKSEFTVFSIENESKKNEFTVFESENEARKKEFTLFEHENEVRRQEFTVFETESEENKQFKVFTLEGEAPTTKEFNIMSSQDESQEKDFKPMSNENKKTFEIFSNEDLKSEEKVNDIFPKEKEFNDFKIESNNKNVEPSKMLNVLEKDMSIKTKEYELFLTENEPLPVGIPYVASPGMTYEQLSALRGKETKENFPPEFESKEIQYPPRRSLAGILKPSKNIPFLPLDEQDDDTEDDGETPLSKFEMTNITQAFKLPLLASTPMAPNKNQKFSLSPEIEEKEDKVISPEQPKSTNFILENDIPNLITPPSNTTKTPEIISNNRQYILSPIMETSKESGSGSLGNAATRYPSQSLVETLPAIPETKSFAEAQDQVQTKDSPKLNRNLKLNLKQKQLFVNSENEDIDPFDDSTNENFLTEIKFPEGYKNITIIKSKMPRIAANEVIELDSNTYQIKNLIGDGGYAKVYKALLKKQPISLKVQTPACPWEAYISNEIERRLNDLEAAKLFGFFHSSYIYSNGSILLSDFSNCGTLLDCVNKIKTKYSVKSKIQIFTVTWAKEMLMMLNYLRKCKIIHADIKPDNILIDNLDLRHNNSPSLKLIDFGRGIDMNLYPENTTFRKKVKTDGFQCVEMITDKPWTYQIDIFGVAASIHCVLFGEYLKLKKVNNRWTHSSYYPRYFDTKFWSKLFDKLLNIESCQNIPDFMDLIIELDNLKEEQLKKFPSMPSQYF